ncbi:MAG: flagellar hook capping FlgD N-terminal domain-containing protein [Pseudomonadota bacterium]
MDVSTILGGATPAASPAASTAKSVLSTDFEVFLTMLTAQAEYQDPLEPMDSSEYAAQLAQFSMVEQQVTTNDLMEQVLAALGTGEMASAANWIGKDALVTGPTRFEGDPVTISPNPPLAADEVTLIVSNQAGTEVQRVPLPTSAAPFQWTGVNDAGALLEYGDYTFQIEAKAEGEVLVTEPALFYSRISEARIENGQTLLVLDSGYMIDTQNVIGLRDPAT